MRTSICRCKGWTTGRGYAGISSTASSRATAISPDARLSSAPPLLYLVAPGAARASHD